MPQDHRWLLLIHSIPPKPNYFRVKVWRKLSSLGAVAVKNSVYVLPKTDVCHEAFQWLSREIIQGKGEATICEASFIEGLSDQQIENLFNEARSKEYEEISKSLRGLSKKITPRAKNDHTTRKEIENEFLRSKQKLSEIMAIDYFGASGRETAQGLTGDIENKLLSTSSSVATIENKTVQKEDLQERVWVTRRGIHVDRIASAWLIQRFIDRKARFKFVEGKSYSPKKDELRFDMFEAEFTHEGELCTFEVLIERANLSSDRALKEIGQIIHNIDLRDHKYQREDVQGIEQVINGICMANKDDEMRLEHGISVMGALYEYFRRKNK